MRKSLKVQKKQIKELPVTIDAKILDPTTAVTMKIKLILYRGIVEKAKEEVEEAR